MEKEKTLKEELERRSAMVDGIRVIYFSTAIKLFEERVKKLKEHPSSQTIHYCPENDEDFECKCTNPKIQEENFYCFEKEVFDKIMGDFST